MIKPILIYPRRELRVGCLYLPDDDHTLAEIQRNKEALSALIQDLSDTLEAIPGGVGLSANQIGNPDLPVAVLQPGKHSDYKGTRDKFVALYPQILESSDPIQLKEGCLSLPNYFDTLTRFQKVKVKYFTLEGTAPIIEEADGVEAQIWQHEVDHLNGVCFVDHLSSMKRDMAVKKMTKIRRRIEDFEWTPQRQGFFGSKGS
jgi:peptide deformylase